MAARSDDDIRRRYGLDPGAQVRRASSNGQQPVRLTPDSFTEVTLASTLDGAAWDRPVVVAGTTVQLSVRGTFVGEGSPLGVRLHDARSTVLGRGAGPMHRDRAVVEVAVDRRAAEREPDGVLAAADVALTELGLTLVSAPLLVLPFAELTRAAWSAERTQEGETVGLSCRIEGSAAGVERLGREPAEVAVFVRTASGKTPLDEPVVLLRVQAERGEIRAEWAATLGLDRWDLPSQAEHDAEADRVGAPRGEAPYLYDRPHLVFRVRLAGLEAESGPLAIDDTVSLLHTVGGEPAAGRGYRLTLPDGADRTGSLASDGTAEEPDIPPGSVTVSYDEAEAPASGTSDLPPPPSS